ncbi:hypothetical protein [Xanthobacter sediminis]|uniref:hypothetical protein n=1 Tax=Xanthobacter sediminis TaxID=3119926 RepID=UPI00372CB035
MKSEWPEFRNGKPTGRLLSGQVPAEIEEIAGIIGFDLTAKLLLEFGGSAIYVPRDRPRTNSELVELLGVEAAIELGREVGGSTIKPPVGNKFIARYLRSRGMSANKIARKIRTSTVTGEMLLKEDRGTRSAARADRLDKSADRLKASANRMRKREHLRSAMAQAPRIPGKTPK